VLCALCSLFRLDRWIQLGSPAMPPVRRLPSPLDHLSQIDRTFRCPCSRPSDGAARGSVEAAWPPPRPRLHCEIAIPRAARQTL